jgi:hypothetical protein
LAERFQFCTQSGYFCFSGFGTLSFGEMRLGYSGMAALARTPTLFRARIRFFFSLA